MNAGDRDIVSVWLLNRSSSAVLIDRSWTLQG